MERTGTNIESGHTVKHSEACEESGACTHEGRQERLLEQTALRHLGLSCPRKEGRPSLGSYMLPDVFGNRFNFLQYVKFFFLILILIIFLAG